MKEVSSKSYTLRTEDGAWLGQVVLTSDGMYASVTDYGNLSYAWRHYGDGDFRKFICTIEPDYFATKMATGMSYMVYSKKFDKACMLYAERILPALKKVLKEELEKELSSVPGIG